MTATAIATAARALRHANDHWRRVLPLLVALCLWPLFAAPRAQAAPLPGDSVYQLQAPLVDQAGKASTLADGRGQVRVVSMFYTSCKFVCPLIIDTLRRTERELDPASRDRLRVLLVSLDPARDTPQALAQLASQRKVDTTRWTLARTDASHVRRLAAVLDIQYKQLADGEFSHSTSLVLLDGEGRILARTDRLGEADETFVAALREALAGP